MKIKLAIFASGGGSNALKIIEYFRGHENINVALIVTNQPHAGVIQHAEANHLPYYIHEKGELSTDTFTDFLTEHKIGAIILAGYLKKIPQALIEKFSNRIINIHPALLPKYGGKGMYGHFVHEAVVRDGEKQSGLTIHLVNEKYDEGRVLFQAICPVFPHDNANEVAKRVLALEHKYFATVIERHLLSLQQV